MKTHSKGKGPPEAINYNKANFAEFAYSYWLYFIESHQKGAEVYIAERRDNMIQIAIAEDSIEEQQRLLTNLKRYVDENKMMFQFSVYDNALTFLEERKAFDIVFMDIIMPHITGMEAAMRLRQYDERVVLIFVTTTAQFAAKGYEVDALDYILKPVSYERLTMKLRKAIEVVESDEGSVVIINDA